nr:hypothetical protein [Tanacetum cinerariifolium]
MVEFLGAIPINLKGNRWETIDFDDDWCWKKLPKEGDAGVSAAGELQRKYAKCLLLLVEVKTDDSIVISGSA